MKIKNLEISPKIGAAILAGTISLTTLTGCNATIVDTKYTFNKAIIFNDNTATIVEIKKWADYDGEQLQIITEDGLIIVTSSFDTKLINDNDSEIKAEDIVRSILGEDAVINYLGENTTNSKSK